MANNLQATKIKTEIDRYSEAVKTHSRIMTNGEICAKSLCEICLDLKKMRDERLYLQFDYDSFEDYCEQGVGMKARQAYNYISTVERLGAAVLQSNADLGITKLELIAGVNPQERTRLLKDGELDELSVAQIREIVKKSKEQGEQISLLETELQEQKMQAQTEILHAKAEARSSAKAEVEKRLQEELKRAQKAAVKEERNKQARRAEEDKRKIEELQAALAAAESGQKELARKLELSDGDSARATVYLQNIQESCNALLQLIAKMENTQAQKFKHATEKLATAMLNAAQESDE